MTMNLLWSSILMGWWGILYVRRSKKTSLNGFRWIDHIYYMIYDVNIYVLSII